MYKNRFCVLYWCPYQHCVINGLEWQNDFELFLQFVISVCQWNLQKQKLLINLLCMWQMNLKKLRWTFFKTTFCHLTSRPSIIACELSRKKRLGLALFSRDGWVITNIFFRLVSSLGQRAQPSENKLLRTCFTIFNELQSIIFFLQRIENKKTLNGSPILKKVFLSIHSSRILSAWIT